MSSIAHPRAAVVLALIPFVSVAITGCASTESSNVAAGAVAEQPGSSPALLTDARPLTGSRATLWVQGMSCPKCVSNVDLQLAKVPGVEKVAINMGLGAVSVSFAGTERPSAQQLARAVENAGLTLIRIEQVP